MYNLYFLPSWIARVTALFGKPTGYVKGNKSMSLLLYTPSRDNRDCTYILHAWGHPTKETVIVAKTLSMMEYGGRHAS